MGQRGHGVARAAAIAIALASFVGPVAGAQAINWTNWTSVTAGEPGSATGTMGSVTVTYIGEVLSGSQTTGGGIQYFNPTNAQHPFSAGTYAGGTAPNGPGANTGFIQLQGGTPLITNTLTFSSPVNNLFFAVISLGQSGNTVAYAFNHGFTIEAQGPGWWGGCNTCLTGSGTQTLSGTEGDGTLMFNEPITSLTWTADPAEYWHGFSVGAQSTVPEPSSMALLGTGLIGLVP
ncbi:MAG TPA: PEP-CTERM sorting domain-containing protein, partial [Gemmatimonadaceae bacterium]